ncbi:MAG: hypothetical protein ACLR43_02375 [Faecalibacillus faecis]
MSKQYQETWSSSVQVTLDRYVTFTPEMDDEAVDIFDGVINDFFSEKKLKIYSAIIASYANTATLK